MIREATPDDASEIVGMIRELAAYERAAEQVEADEQAIRAALFGPKPKVFALVAEHAGFPVGFALWFLSFSTWTGQHGIYLEDLFVRPANRGQGHGQALLGRLAGIAVERGYRRLEWAVLDWNTPATGFYAALGATPMADWTVWRSSGAALDKLAATERRSAR
ncbi:MAG: GNAT family N-acetyltransferase [Frankiaceae bacterium]